MTTSADETSNVPAPVVYRSKPTHRIASLDFETLDLNPQTTIVFDAAVCICTADCTNPDEVERHGWRLNIFEQIAMGRTMTTNTSRWHVKRMGREKFQKHLEGTSESASFYVESSVKDFLHSLEQICKTVDEIWINGLSFDTTITKSLADSLGMDMPWYFRKEVDVRSMHKRVPYQEKGIIAKLEKEAAHDATADALWNLNQALSFHEWTTLLPDYLYFKKTTKV